MKIRHRKKKRQQSLIWSIVFCLISGGLWRGRSQRTLQVLREEFASQVTPLQEKMSNFSELDLSFLSGDMLLFPREVVAYPQVYITQLKKSFRNALEVYNMSSPKPLAVEIDAGELIASLSLEQKVAQLFVLGFAGTTLTQEDVLFLKSQQPGGVILMGRNVSDTLSGLTMTIQEQAKQLPFFVAIDQEGGQVARVKEGLPTQAELDLEEVCPTYLERSELLHKQGVNLNLGIIADVTEDASSFIYQRVFRGEVDDKITDAVHCTTETLSTLKHFPGHGMTLSDTHAGVVSVDLSREEREKIHLPSFVAGIHAGVDAIMTAHLQLPRIDEKLPASLSFTGVSLLREQGFDGLIITDDLGMLRADYTEKEAIKLALLAGNDLLLFVNPSDGETLLTYTVELVRDGLIPLSSLDTHLERIIRAKNKIIKLDRYVPLELVK